MSLLLTVSRTALMAAILAPTLLLSDKAFAADLSPAYVGADLGLVSNYGQQHASGRIYGGYTVGSTIGAFNKEDVHAVELMAYSLSARSEKYAYLLSLEGRDQARATGFAVNWASSLKATDRWAVTSRLGIDYTHAKTYQPEGGSTSWNSVGWVAGLGTTYALDQHWKLTADWNYMPFKVGRRTRVDNSSLNAGVVYAF
jgi:opacity protein-like surface antigen